MRYRTRLERLERRWRPVDPSPKILVVWPEEWPEADRLAFDGGNPAIRDALVERHTGHGDGPMARLSRRVARLQAWLDPQPDADFLAFARAVIAWGVREPTEAGARELAQALQGTEQGATWTTLMALAEEAPLDVPIVDPTRLMPAGRESNTPAVS